MFVKDKFVQVFVGVEVATGLLIIKCFILVNSESQLGFCRFFLFDVSNVVKIRIFKNLCGRLAKIWVKLQ